MQQDSKTQVTYEGYFNKWNIASLGKLSRHRRYGSRRGAVRHANISVTLNIYAQAITQSKRDAQSRVVSLLLDKNEEKPSTEAYRTLTDVQNSGGDLQVVEKVGVPDGI